MNLGAKRSRVHRRIRAASIEVSRGHAVGSYAPLQMTRALLSQQIHQPRQRLRVGANRSPLLRLSKVAEAPFHSQGGLGT
jgi:hypothetical protein